MKALSTPVPSNPAEIASRILLIRGRKVMIDADLAELYGVATKRLNEQVRRNGDRFADYFFQLTAAERSEVVANCDHLARLKFSPALPYAFTEHGALMAASVLNTARAVEVGRYVVQAFVQQRELLTPQGPGRQAFGPGTQVRRPRSGDRRNHRDHSADDGATRNEEEADRLRAPEGELSALPILDDSLGPLRSSCRPPSGMI